MASPNTKPEPEASQEQEASNPRSSSEAGATPDAGGYYEGMKVTAPEKRDTFGKAFIHIFVAAAVFGGGLYLYWEKVERDKMVHDLAVDARAMYLRDNYRDLMEADRLLDEALDINGRHRYSLATKGLINAYLWHDHGMEDRRQVAEEFTRQAEERSVHLQERYGARGLLMVMAGEEVEAERLLVEDVINEGGTGPAIFGSLALSQRLQGKRADARGSLQRASEAERRTPRFNYWIAQTYFDGEEHRNTARFIEQALDVNPDHIPTLILRARNQIDVDDGDLEEASRALQEILERSNRELSPYNKALALVGMAELHNAERRFDEAVASAEEALSLASDLPDAHVVKGIAMLNSEQDGALASIRKGLDMFEHMPRGYHRAARALMHGERLEEARELMDLWGERVTRNAAYHIAFGNLLLGGEETDDAKTHFERAIELNPRAAEAHYRLGQLALENEELGDERVATAIEHFNEAVRVRERYPEVYEAMGWIYLQQRAYAEGLRQFVQALTLYRAQNVDREKLDTLREEVGELLTAQRQGQLARAWIQESQELVR